MENKKIGVISLGCDKNRVDTEYMLSIIGGSKYTLTANAEDADIIVINTCAFLQAARAEAIDTILECHKLRGRGVEKIVVTGCLSQKYIEEIFDDLQEADVFLGTKDYDLLPEALELAYSGKRVNFVGKKQAVEHKGRVLSTAGYAYLKISEGCDNKCTYCLIPKIRGKYKSESLEKLIGEAKSLGEVSELILVAQDITRYGSDFGGSLSALIDSLSALDNIKSIRLLYCYPDLIDEKLISALKNNKKLIKYIDMPLQHSEDKILKLMNRKGSRAAYLNLIKRLKGEVEGIAVRSTFIAGFPGESAREHRGMLKFLKEAQLFNAGFFAYSREEDTPAYSFDGQVPEKVKQRWVKRLYRAQKKIAAKILKGYIGKELEVVCDGQSLGLNKGRAYFSAPDIDTYIYFGGDTAQAGSRYFVHIKGLKGLDLYGEIAQKKEN